MDTQSSVSSSASGMKAVTRKYLFELTKSQNLPNFDKKLEYLENYMLECYGDTEETKKSLKHKFSYVKSQMKQRWLKAHKAEEVFLKNNKSWLAGTFDIPLKTKTTVDSEVIVHAAKSIEQRDGKRNAYSVHKEVANSPTRASKYRNDYSNNNETIPSLTPFEALKMFVEADLTQQQYEIIRAANKRHYPCYDLLFKAKLECYPPKAALLVTATCAEMDLQSLLDHTITRLSMFLEEVLITLNDIEKQTLKIIVQWGCDGSQQARYTHEFSNDADSDANIFLSVFVPVQMVCGEENKRVVWRNPSPSSPRLCRPIRFRYVKESTDVTKEEISYIENAAKSLNATKVNLNGGEFTFSYIMKMTKMMPFGQLSEEAAEARNKYFRSLEQNFARKFSREECNLDIYHRLLLISDPLLSTVRDLCKPSLKPFLSETIA